MIDIECNEFLENPFRFKTKFEKQMDENLITDLGIDGINPENHDRCSWCGALPDEACNEMLHYENR